MKIDNQLLHGLSSKDLLCQIYLRGVFIARSGDILVHFARDERGLDLVSSGQRQLGFIGSDRLDEWILDGSFEEPEVIDCVPIKCRLVLAGLAGVPNRQRLFDGEELVTTTSYPYTTRKVSRVNAWNLVPEFVEGGCEGEVASGLSDLVYDITDTGNTIRDNGLEIIDQSDRLSLVVVRGIKRATKPDLREQIMRIVDTYRSRILSPKIGSLTSLLLRDENEAVKKLGSEFTELLQELLDDESTSDRVVSEGADLLYAVSMFLTKRGLSILDILEEDIRRSLR
ncbi:hypothetical protein KC992_02870 [Candidatus Saccharibacteria bacterium]|nr:hypothetical protein [Candidatus Saccharibacteria bacterium]MCA9328294.1 hypothetical protein [Candidatus Saccharibacteria bacterium]